MNQVTFEAGDPSHEELQSNINDGASSPGRFRLGLHPTGKHTYVDLKGRPVNMSKTGGWHAVPFCLSLSLGSAACYIIVFTLSTYLFTHMHQSPDKAAVIVANFGGTFYLLTLLGGFLADSYLGAYKTILIGILFKCMGLTLLTISSAYSKLQPGPCAPNVPCPPAGPRYMAPLYAALYTVCIGEGLVKPNIMSLGAGQFDDTIPEERALGTQYFRYVFFFLYSGLLIAGFPGVYLTVVVSPGWGYGATLMLYAFCSIFFLLGTPKLRHQPTSGSFLTRMAQVCAATMLKRWPLRKTIDPADLYDPKVPPGSMFQKLDHTNNLRLFDRAAIISGEGDKEIAIRGTQSWRLCSVTQVEEAKRILQLLPFLAISAFGAIIFSLLSSLQVQAAATLDRSMGPHFTIPAPAVSGFIFVFAIMLGQVYHKVGVPLIQKFNHNPYGFKPLQRLGASILVSALTIVCAALIERKRLSVVREHHLQNLVLGSFVLPMRVWWLLPQFFLAGLADFTLALSSYEFYYHETSSETRNLGSSFFWVVLALGFYFSSVMVNLVNRVTRNQRGGGWLKGQLNDGGLEKFYWLLAVLLAIDFLLFLAFAYKYEYKYDWCNEQNQKSKIESLDEPLETIPEDPE